MDTAQIQTLIEQAKYLYDHGAFSTLDQGEFFKGMEAAIAAPAPTPPPSPAPPAP